MKDKYLIKQVSEMTGLRSSTIRYYEKEGLINPVLRDKNGIRQYSEQDLRWIVFLSKLKSMEMPIHEMKLYAKLREHGDSTIKERIVLLENHRLKLEEKAAAIRTNMVLLEDKINIYQKMEEKKNEK